MKFSELNKKSCFDENIKYYPHPQYYSIPEDTRYKRQTFASQSLAAECGSFGKAARFSLSLSTAQMKGISSHQNPSTITSVAAAALESQLAKLQLFNEIQIPQSLLDEHKQAQSTKKFTEPTKKRPVTFKSTFKNIKTAVQREYGEGLAKIMQNSHELAHEITHSPGPQDYNPSKTFVMRRAPQLKIAPPPPPSLLIQQQSTLRPRNAGTIPASNRGNSTTVDAATDVINREQDTITQNNLSGIGGTERARKESFSPAALAEQQYLLQQRMQKRNPKDQNLQIIVENKEAKIAILPDRENQLLEDSKIFAIQQPKIGMLRKAKIVKNIYDLARDDQFDPTHSSTSIETYLLRQRQLGQPQVPAPGTYFDAERMSSFHVKKANAVAPNTTGGHGESPSKRQISFHGNASDSDIFSKEQVGASDNQETLYERKKRKYLETVFKNQQNIEQLLNPINQQQQQQQQQPSLQYHKQIQQPQQQMQQVSSSPQLQFFNPENSPQLLEKQKQYEQKQEQQLLMQQKPKRVLAAAASSTISSTFGKSKKLVENTIASSSPGPGSYTSPIMSMNLQERLQGEIYFSSVFGSGTKRFS